MSTHISAPAGPSVADRLLTFALTVSLAAGRARTSLLTRLAAARQRGQRGASALEWVLYTAAAVVIVGIVVVAIKGGINTKADQVKQCIEGTTTDSNGGCS
ncbi:hypothetical protein ACFY00_25130 [Kitasatospora sp. NPDC001540]|uniref:hypothetical protein n=1 Tax=Kitasatospora sp. NPDC001540 TaxID=3364014 RepID=UPI00369A4751